MSDVGSRVFGMLGKALRAVVITVGALLFAGFLQRVWATIGTKL